MSESQVLIIGAGPFGLSISAHLHQRGVEHQIVGRPVDTWRAHMPAGMKLKSEPYASDIAAPLPGYSLAAYCRVHGLPYVNRIGPVTLERFVDYADWYAEQLVPSISDVTVTRLTAKPGGFVAEFADTEPVAARQVVIATGVLPYAAIPAELRQLPSDLVSHSADHRHLDGFSGRRVAVIGAGQSALETAALLQEDGAEVQLITRRQEINWITANPLRLNRLEQIKRPATKLGEGYRIAFWNSPGAFRMLPAEMRITKARTVLGPGGAWWLKSRVDGVIDTLTEHHLRSAAPSGSGVRLHLDGQKRTSIDVDHVIAGTGFRIDLARLAFLPPDLRARITTLAGYPVLSRASECTVPGLYFVGAPATVSLGPAERFLAGTHNSVRQLTRLVLRRSKANDPLVAADALGLRPELGADPTYEQTT